MSTTVIVGGGLSGLITASLLKKRGRDVLGLEATTTLGGRVLSGHHRLCAESSVRFVDELVPNLTWETVEQPAVEWKKGGWSTPGSDFGPMEKFYLSPRFYAPAMGFGSVIDKLRSDVESLFRLHKSVSKVRSKEKRVVCTDGEEFSYSDLVWCAPLELLIRVYEGSGLADLKLPKRKLETGGISLDQFCSRSVFSHPNTVVLPFRYKEHRLRALGTQSNDAGPKGETCLHWILYLGDSLLENREEVAKCVRALKREVGRAFPEIPNAVVKERLVFLSNISGESVVEAKELRVDEHIVYSGAQIRLPDTSDLHQNLDLLFENCRKLHSIFPAV